MNLLPLMVSISALTNELDSQSRRLKDLSYAACAEATSTGRMIQTCSAVKVTFKSARLGRAIKGLCTFYGAAVYVSLLTGFGSLKNKLYSTGTTPKVNKVPTIIPPEMTRARS